MALPFYKPTLLRSNNKSLRNDLFEAIMGLAKKRIMDVPIFQAGRKKN
jgi:hypothetical protein